MTSAELRTLPAEEAATLSPPLHALWQDAHGHWDRAHSLVDELETPDACRVHAYLHRKEGNDANAAYWYAKIGQPPFTGSFDDEWTALATYLLKL
jgi:hypothetical protein